MTDWSDHVLNPILNTYKALMLVWQLSIHFIHTILYVHLLQTMGPISDSIDYRLGDLLIPGRDPGSHPASYPVCVHLRLLSLRVKLPGHEADHSPPSRPVVFKPFLFAYPPDVVSLHLYTPPTKLLVYNSSCTQSVMYIKNKLKKLRPK
jgi:hypothetical protein